VPKVKSAAKAVKKNHYDKDGSAAEREVVWSATPQDNSGTDISTTGDAKSMDQSAIDSQRSFLDKMEKEKEQDAELVG